jgi:hypothetical protein
MNVEPEEIELDYPIPQTDDAVLILPLAKSIEYKQKKCVLYAETTLAMLKILRTNGIGTNLAYGNIDEIVYRENRSIDWFAPALLFVGTAISQNPDLVSITLNVISSYLYDIFKGKKDDPNVHCKFAVQVEGKKVKSIKYEGPVSGIMGISSIIQEMTK